MSRLAPLLVSASNTKLATTCHVRHRMPLLEKQEHPQPHAAPLTLRIDICTPSRPSQAVPHAPRLLGSSRQRQEHAWKKRAWGELVPCFRLVWASLGVRACVRAQPTNNPSSADGHSPLSRPPAWQRGGRIRAPDSLTPGRGGSQSDLMTTSRPFGLGMYHRPPDASWSKDGKTTHLLQYYIHAFQNEGGTILTHLLQYI